MQPTRNTFLPESEADKDRNLSKARRLHHKTKRQLDRED